MITLSNLHYKLIKGIIENGFAPEVEDLSKILDANKNDIIRGLYELQEYHGVVLHPREPKVWVIHPFATAPTNFYVECKKGEWWGNCAWCSLGIAALVGDDVTITTTIGAEKKQIKINIINGEILEKNYYVHFPIPMKKAWDNVVYTCSNMLVFENRNQVGEWSTKHNIPQGDLQPIENIWNFSKKWYGRHLDPTWTKWTVEEARQIFKEYELTGQIWDLGESKERF